ncbi:ABC transporter ATP-binding protein [Acidisphaera sp. L21]|uniref:ABC transporter ATP-binding protein n=1 Tax=Acidisphaera sp. L21 TaxID=1641851 RepID=UPI00131BB397|nr:oligopeptide/dipeptide ABC transporter ATP-binding protein [Acidisphaera sp. L21]
MPLLEVEHLTRSFTRRRGIFGPSDAVRAVDDVSFTLGRGETLGLVGESGSGKSTLGRLVLRLIAADSGSIRLDGTDIVGLPTRQVRALRRQMQMVFQDPYGSLDPRMTAGSIILEPMRVHGIPMGERHRRLEDTMRRVGLDPAQAGRYPHQFSGGQRQRIGIARAMTLAPRLLVLDEPVSALDVSIQAQIINLLQKLQRENDLSFLFIAHDLAVVRHISHRVAVMYLGRIIEVGPRESLYGTPLHPYTITLLSAVPVPDPVLERRRSRIASFGEIGSAAHLPGGCRFHPRCYRARLVAKQPGTTAATVAGETLPQRCVEHDPALTPLASGHAAACHFPELPETRSPIAERALTLTQELA